MLSSIGSTGATNQTGTIQSGGINVNQVQNIDNSTNINIQFGNQPLSQCSCGIISASNSDDIKKIFELLALMLKMAMMQKFMDAFQQMSQMLSPQGYDKGGQSSSSEIYVMGSKDSSQAIIGVPDGCQYMGHQGPAMLQTDGATISPCDMSGMQGISGASGVAGAAGVSAGGMGGAANIGGS